MEWFAFDLGLGTAAALVLAIMLAITYNRHRRLQRMDFLLTGPDVPRNILDTVKGAEIRFYEDLPWLRKRAEDLQDIAGLAAPTLVMAMNFSVGVYRIKGRTVQKSLGTAREEGWSLGHCCWRRWRMKSS